MHLVDCHCHIDLFPDMQKAIAQSEADNIYTIAVTTTPRAWGRNLEMTKGTRYVRAALGIHPQLVTDKVNELELFKKYINETSYIGEIGLDGTTQSASSIDRQCDVFADILNCCSALGGKILSVHSRNSSKEVLDIIEEKLPTPKNKVILHWFTGNKLDVSRALELGCYFSINSKMLSSKKALQLAACLPAEKILTETDFPFTCDEKSLDQPRNIENCIKILSAVRSCSVSEMKKNIWDNFYALLSITSL